MNPRQRSVLLAGIFFAALTALYPPWDFVDEYLTPGGLGTTERFAGYHFFFVPPTPDLPHSRHEHLLIGTASHIDTGRLTVEWGAIVLVVIGLLLLLRSRPIPPPGSEPTKSPRIDPGLTEVQKTSSLDNHVRANVSKGLPNGTAGPSKETHKLLEFLVNADHREFEAATAAILQCLQLTAREKDLAYSWITKNRNRFAALVFLDRQPRNRFEVSMVAYAKRLMPEVETHLRSITWAIQKVTITRHRVAPHWAIKDLLDERVNLDALAEEAVKEGLTSELYTDHDPLLFLVDRDNPQLPPWVPAEYGRPLSPVERVEWFDQLLRRDYGTSSGWPPTSDANTRRREVTMCLYRMYLDRVTGMLPEPSFVLDEQRSQSSTREPKKP